ncbi:MAG TPA: DUF6089 family protein [Cytophagaceae bacterium]|jgi:hypothetical protein|nr:DUF6089 family protein [Cytophagaceae bacterium]
MHCFINKYFKKTGKISLPVFLFLLLSIDYNSFGQKHEFGIGAGGFTYVGDINPRFRLANYRPGGMLFYRYNSANRYTAIRVGVSIGQLAGSEDKSKQAVPEVRQASFTSSIDELSVMGEYNFINYRDKKQLLKFSPYMTAGLAIFASNPVVKSNSNPESSGTQNANIALPFGVGIKFILSKYWNLNTEFIARKTFTDYLDGISNGQIGTKSTGNPLDTDWYFYTGISVSYTIYGVKCPQALNY